MNNLNPLELSLKEQIALTNPELLKTLDKELLLYNYSFNARPKQQFPGGDWLTWLIKSGRGFGKSWVGSNWVIHRAKTYKEPIAIIGKNAADVRDVQVEVGASSILKLSPPWFKPEYQPSKRRLVFPNNVIAILYSAEDPDLLRGPQHGSAWCDEFCKFQYPQELWDNLLFGLRLGTKPQVVITTTPRPIKTLRQIAKDPKTVVTTGATFENRFNLANVFLDEIKNRYDGTRLGRQELYGEILEDVPGALWSYTNLDNNRVTKHPELKQIVVAIDPAVTADEDSNETGIIVCGIDENDHGYIIEDASGIYHPQEWSTLAVKLYDKYKANYIVAEVNQGGEMVVNTIKQTAKGLGHRHIPVKHVHATKGKYTRGEPVAVLYEQNKVHHVGSFATLEDQMTSYLPGDKISPDRMDALVWGLYCLMVKHQETTINESPW
jgi:phage terminase large subunit-like protein